MAKHPFTSNCVLFLTLLSACAEGTCPVGSRAMGEQCVSLDECPTGQERRNGVCAAPDDLPAMSDASHLVDGGDSGVGSDAALPMAGSTPSAAGSGAPDTGVGEIDPCAEVDCGEHGVCEVDLMGAANCACDANFTGEFCDACVAGFGLSSAGDCVPLCDAANAIDCGPFGTCLADDSGASCSCTHPHAGERCELCAEGYALDDGECVPDCGECGRHEFCDETLHVPSCACAAGYARAGDSCTWVGDGVTGGIKDRDLDDPRQWEPRQVVQRDGTARFMSIGIGHACTVGELSQTIEMPSREDAEPFVLDIETLTSCTDTNPDRCPALLVEIGDTVRRVGVAGGPPPGMGRASICLGSAAYGGSVPLRVRPSIMDITAANTYDCRTTEWPTLRAIRIRPANSGECEPVGSSWNDLTSPARWTLSEATIAGGRLSLGDNGRATRSIEFPSGADMPSPALRFTQGASYVAVQLNGLFWSIFRNDQPNAKVAHMLCLPNFAQGAFHDVTLYALGSGEISNLDIVSEPSCGDGAFDRGFERDLSTGSWSANSSGMVRERQAAGSGHILRTPSDATGNLVGLLRFPRVDSEGAGRPAFEFLHRPASNGIGVYTLEGLGPFLQEEFDASTWSQKILCLPHALEGQLVNALLTLSGRRSTSSPNANDQSVWIDDAGPLLSSSCP